MHKTRWTRLAPAIILAALLLSVIASACMSASKYPLTVTDDMGRKIVFDTQPKRFVSLAPSWTEILFALGLGDQVVGVTTYCDYPAEAAKKEKVGGFSDPNIELIVALKADVVFGTTLHKKVQSDIERRGIKFVCENATSVEGVKNNITITAAIAGVPERAQQVNAVIQNTIDRVKNTLAAVPESRRLKVLYLVWDEPVMSVGPKTLISDMLSAAGGVSITGDAESDYPSYSLETIVAVNPDVILAPRVHGGGGLDIQSLRTKPGWQALDAVKKGNVYLVEDNLVSRPGPRVGEGVLEIARTLYPELFK